MLYKHKKTGTRLKVHLTMDEGEFFMVEDQDGKVFTVYKNEIEEDAEAEKKLKTMQVKDKAQGEETAKEIKDYQMSLSGERFKSLEQLKKIPRVDWDSVIAANLIRV